MQPFLLLNLLASVLLFASTASSADDDNSQQSVASLALEINIPRLQVAEYHRPYLGIWISDTRQQRVADIGVWYDLSMANDEGHKWLPDLRQWWRRSGRSLDLPVDGVSGATRPPGLHTVDITPTTLAQLQPGDYILHVEAAREVGGREHLQLPFSWPATEGAFQSAQGQHELGLVRLLAVQP